MDINTPVIFADGSQLFADLAKTYVKHDSGLFILAPSGAGKTYFVNQQTDKHWIDGDYLWPLANADLTSEDWGNETFEQIMEINNKSDIITQQAKKQGFWVVGSSNHWLKPDAIVLPDWETHKKYILKREHGEYDGGAKEENLEGVQNHRNWIAKWEEQGVPRFESIQAAAEYLAESNV